MANKVLLKKSSVAERVPITSDLDYGELALNYADGKLYFKDSSNNIKSFTEDSSVVTLTGTQTLTNKTLTSPTISGNITGDGAFTGYLKSLNSQGDEGGEILLAKPATNSTISGTGITIDAYQNKIRIFEQGGDARGAYIDITACSAGVGTNLLGGGVTSDSFKTISVSGQSNVVADSSTDTLTLAGSTGLTITTNDTTDTITFTNSGVLSVDSNTGAVTATQLLTSIKTVDGASSGLDADLLDGQEGSYYLNANNLTNTSTVIENWDRNVSMAQIGTNGVSGSNYYLKIFDTTFNTNSSFHFKIDLNVVLNGSNMTNYPNWGQIFVDGYRTTGAPTVNVTFAPYDYESTAMVFSSIVYTYSTAGQLQIWIYQPYLYTYVYGKLTNLTEADSGSPYSIQQADLSRGNSWTTGYTNLGSAFNAEYPDIVAEDYYGTYDYTTYMIPGSYLSLDSSAKYINLVDSAQIRLGTSTDSRIWYDGTNNTLDVELESTASSFNITNNGSDLFVVTRSTGNASVTGDLHVAGGDITTGSVTSSVFNTTATTVNAFGAATSLTLGATSGTTTVRNDLTVTGNLTINGTTTTINSTTLTVDDKNIVLASGAADSTAADGSGISVDGASATITYVHSGTKWALNKNVDITGTLTTSSNGTIGGTLDVTGETTLSGNLVVQSTIEAGGGTGTSGQVLTSTGTGVEWTTPASAGYDGLVEFSQTGITTSTTVYSASATTYRGAKYTLQVTNSTAYGMYEFFIMHDGTSIYFPVTGASYVTDNDGNVVDYFSGDYVDSLATMKIQVGSTYHAFSWQVTGGNLVFSASCSSGTLSVKGTALLIKA